ncbi:hypothetical protein Tco_1430760 [Tanacetum coccineum]
MEQSSESMNQKLANKEPMEDMDVQYSSLTPVSAKMRDMAHNWRSTTPGPQQSRGVKMTKLANTEEVHVQLFPRCSNMTTTILVSPGEARVRGIEWRCKLPPAPHLPPKRDNHRTFNEAITSGLNCNLTKRAAVRFNVYTPIDKIIPGREFVNGCTPNANVDFTRSPGIPNIVRAETTIRKENLLEIIRENL